MKILVVEDNEKLAENIKKYLELEGFIVDLAYDGNEGLDLALSYNYDCIILDIILPGMSGIEICRFLRNEENSQVPILMLTALGSVENRVEGLNAGADDYMPKPFDLRELVARVRALIRRNQVVRQETLKYGDLVMNLQTREASCKGEPLNLSSKEFSLLELFMRNPGVVFSREQILDKLWESGFEPRSNIVDVYVLYLRKKLKPFDYDEKIETVHNIGYRLKKEDDKL